MTRGKHGMTGTPEHRAWLQMRSRCTLKTLKDWPRYGGRGVGVCERWSSFDNFYADMGLRPDGHSLDRIDNNGNYEPGNCRWATQKQQIDNRNNAMLIKVGNKALNITEWAEELQISKQALSAAIKRARKPEHAVMKRLFRRKRLTVIMIRG